ncbi:serine protease inhibitor swm-1-like [Aquarana catesbeiana]|uniref:serine protease inhibitor swm-1-like n=1 Tax=Aquarana catesbeiana TaxID=8400 RepID=UPI003CCA5326
MVSFSLAVFFVVAALHIQTITGKGVCPKHSHLREVGGCELRCDKLPSPGTPVECIDTKMHKDCKCKKGLLAQSGTSGFTIKCVTAQECQANCGANTHYEPFGSPCKATCEKPTGTEPCKLPGGPRCVCNDGYVMDQNQQNKCVKPNECSPAHKP